MRRRRFGVVSAVGGGQRIAAPAATAASTKSCTRLCGVQDGFALNEYFDLGLDQFTSRCTIIQAIKLGPRPETQTEERRD